MASTRRDKEKVEKTETLHGFEVLDENEVEQQATKRKGRPWRHDDFFEAMSELPLGKVLKVPVPADLDARQYSTQLIAARSYRGFQPPYKGYVWTYKQSENGRILYYRWVKDTRTKRSK